MERKGLPFTSLLPLLFPFCFESNWFQMHSLTASLHNQIATWKKWRREVQQNSAEEKKNVWNLHKVKGGRKSEKNHYLPWGKTSLSLSHMVQFITPFGIFWDLYDNHKPLRDNVHPKWGSKSCVSFMFLADVSEKRTIRRDIQPEQIHILHPCGLNIKDLPTSMLDQFITLPMEPPYNSS